MRATGVVTTVKTGAPVPDGTTVELYLYEGNTLTSTTTTNGGEFSFSFNGNPGPYYIRVDSSSEVHIHSSKVIGVAGSIDISSLPLYFRMWQNGVLRDVLGELAVSANGSGMQVSVAPGVGIVRGLIYDQSGTVTVPISASDSQPRIDVVALEVVPSGANTTTEGRSRLVVVKGSPGAQPVAPSLTQTTNLWQEPIAHVRVDGSAVLIAADKVTDKRVGVTIRLGTGQVDTVHLADGAVTNPKLAVDAVSTDRIVDGAVSGAKLKAGSVTAEKVASNAVGTSSLIDGAVTGDKIASGSVTSGKVAAKSITTEKIADGAVGATQLADGAVTSGKIGSRVVTEPAIGQNAVTAYQIADGSVSASSIANLAVTTAKIANAAVTKDKIAANAVSEDRLDAAVRTKLNASSGADATFKDVNFAATGQVGGWRTLATASLTLAAGKWLIESDVNFTARGMGGSGTVTVQLTGNGSPQGGDESSRIFQTVGGVPRLIRLTGRIIVNTSSAKTYTVNARVVHDSGDPTDARDGVLFVKAWKVG